MGIALILLLLVLGIQLTGNGYLLKAARGTYLHGNNSATIDDARFFDTNTVGTGSDNWEWPLHQNYNETALTDRLESTLQETNSIAFLAIKNDSIILEQYWNGYSDSSRTNSFSMAKTITTFLAQIAIQKGIFKSWEQKVKDFLPELKGPYSDELELWHLSTMSSGLHWDEHYKNPFSITAKAYYGSDIKELLLSLPIDEEPGKKYNYQSGSPQLLGLALIEATGKSLSELTSEWLWKPLSAKHKATWHTDDNGIEMAFCCFNSNARDFARFGKLMIHHGNWNGQQILDSTFAKKAGKSALSPYYGYSFWVIESNGIEAFYQRGILGQYIITIPAQDLVIVRLGHKRMKDLPDQHTEDVHIIIEEVLKMQNV